MSLRTVLRDFVKVIVDEAEQNPDFAERLRVVFESNAETYQQGTFCCNRNRSKGC